MLVWRIDPSAALEPHDLRQAEFLLLEERHVVLDCGLDVLSLGSIVGHLFRGHEFLDAVPM